MDGVHADVHHRGRAAGGHGYCASVPALLGCFTRGDSIEQCRQRAAESIEVHIAGRRWRTSARGTRGSQSS
ncbi:MAG: type II toxin-antitoxin system HicB family antitoxin [Acidimicrobiales bacterium]